MKALVLVLGALAVLAGPVAAPAAAATAADNHVCQSFASPWDRVCAIPIGVYCSIFPTQTICR